jgi:hypothetical protein
MGRMRGSLVTVSMSLAVLLLTAQAVAQPRDGRLSITVVDQTGGVLPSAVVTIAGQDEAMKSVLMEPVTANAQGVATFRGLRPGRYAVKAESSGFEPRVHPDVRVRAGENKETISLAIQKLADTVNVARDRQEVAVDRATTFGSALTREQIEALSDDPAVLRQQLAEMAGGPAIIRVDSFEGAPLPPKAQIKSVHITRDGFAAENHNAGAFFIDIVTQPGLGPLRGQAQYGMRPGTLTGNSPFTPVKGPENMQVGIFVVGGTLAREKGSFSLALQGNTSYTTPNLNIVQPTGSVAQALNLRTPRNNLNVQGLLDYALTKDQTVRLSFYQLHNSADNLGVGAYDEPQRAYNTTDTTTNFRIQHTGPFQRRMFTNTRLSVTHTSSDQASALEAPTIQVLDAFTSGGAQMSGERHATSFTFGSRLRARTPLVSGGAPRRRRILGLDSELELPGHLHVQQPGGVHRGPTEQLHAAPWRSGDRVLDGGCRRLRAGRFPRPPESDDQPRTALRDAGAHARLERSRSAHRVHVGAVQERADRASRQRGHLLRLARAEHIRAGAARGRRA